MPGFSRGGQRFLKEFDRFQSRTFLFLLRVSLSLTHTQTCSFSFLSLARTPSLSEQCPILLEEIDEIVEGGAHFFFGALVLCIEPTSLLPVLQIPILHYEISYGEVPRRTKPDPPRFFLRGSCRAPAGHMRVRLEPEGVE